MYNELIKIGPITVYGYGLMIAMGILTAYVVVENRARKLNLNHERIFALVIWSLIGGILGAKLLYGITQIREILSDPKAIFNNLSNGFVVYGGIIGGILAGFLYCKIAKLNFLQYFDLFVPSIALAQGFGRIGCFLAGCCYGVETTSPFGVVFHQSHFAPNGVRLIPIQLIASGLDFLNFFVLIMFAKRRKADGQIAGFYLLFYSIGRFILEFFRGDLIRGNVEALSTSQFISLFMFALGCVLVLLKSHRSKNSSKDEHTT